MDGQPDVTHDVNNKADNDVPDVLGFDKFLGGGRRDSSSAKMVTDEKSLFYKMDHKNRGLAVIFNHNTFLFDHLKPRNGTDADRDNLKACFDRIGFDVEVHEDFTGSQVLSRIEKIAEMDHSDNDCLVIIVLSHGEEGILYAKDTAYKPENLWQPFTGDKCKTLAGKPKMFFLQACRGSNLDSGVNMVAQTDGARSYKIPVWADFLMVYSTAEGHYSWRNTGRGSWFVQCLVSELNESAFMYDILTTLTFVNRRIATEFISNVPGDHKMDCNKQIACIQTMLTRLVKFTEKKPAKKSEEGDDQADKQCACS